MADLEDFNQAIIDEYRANQGKLSGGFEGVPILLLHHTGARSGTERVAPLTYLRLDDGYAIFATMGGAPTNPAWFHNLVAHPDTEIEVGADRIAVRARVTQGEERDRIWNTQKSGFPPFQEYEAKTSRTIPVVVLEPR